MATQELDPVRIILEKVQEAISSGSAHLREDACPQTHGRGVQIGWKKGTDVFLLKQPTWKFVTESLRGDGFRQPPIAAGEFWSRLHERGYIPAGSAGRTGEVQTRLGGNLIKVVQITMAIGDDLHPLAHSAGSETSNGD